MSSVTRLLVFAGGVTLTAGLGAGCSGDTGPDLRSAGATASHAAEQAPVTTTTTLTSVSDRLDDARRAEVKQAVAAAVDPWLDGGWLGSFPRSDWAPAFAGFTAGAAKSAQGGDVDLMTAAALAPQVQTATATRRRVKVDVFVADGKAHGATAHVTLDFDTTGQAAGSHRLQGDLYLSETGGAWKVFGYDVDQVTDQVADR